MLAVDVNVKMKNQVRRATKKVSIAFRRSSISEYFWGGQMKDSAEFKCSDRSSKSSLF